MEYILYAHPESDCIFWSDAESEGDGMLVELGRSSDPCTQEARRLFYETCPRQQFDNYTYTDNIKRINDMAKAKTLFHGALADMGPVRVTVGGVMEKPGKPDLIELEIKGEKFHYVAEIPECSKFFRGHTGQTFHVQAEGKLREAKLVYVGQPGTSVPPPPAKQAEKEVAQAVEKIVSAVTTLNGASGVMVRGGTPEEEKALRGAKEFVQRNATLAKVALRKFAELYRDYAVVEKGPMPDALCAPLFGTLLYGASGGGFVSHLPRWCDMATLAAMHPEKGEAEKPAAAPAAAAPAQDDVPM